MSPTEPEMNGSEMNEIEAALAAWTPRAPQIDRDRLMFAAGRASIPPPPSAGEGLGEGAVSVKLVATPTHSPIARHFWPLATCLSTAAAVVLAFLLAQQKAETPRDHVIQAATTSNEQKSPEFVAIPKPTANPPLRGEIALPTVADGTYLALRNQMLTTPADQWPGMPTVIDDDRRGAAAVEDDAARQPPTSRNLLREFLPPNRPTRRGSPPARRGPVPARRGSPDPAESPAAQNTQLEEALT